MGVYAQRKSAMAINQGRFLYKSPYKYVAIANNTNERYQAAHEGFGQYSVCLPEVFCTGDRIWTQYLRVCRERPQRMRASPS